MSVAPLPSMALPSILDIAAADRLLQSLREEADGLGILSASAVERVSTPAIQLLLSIDLYLKARGRRLQLPDPSPELRAAIVDLGLEMLLKLWSEPHA